MEKKKKMTGYRRDVQQVYVDFDSLNSQAQGIKLADGRPASLADISRAVASSRNYFNNTKYHHEGKTLIKVSESVRDQLHKFYSISLEPVDFHASENDSQGCMPEQPEQEVPSTEFSKNGGGKHSRSKAFTGKYQGYVHRYEGSLRRSV